MLHIISLLCLIPAMIGIMDQAIFLIPNYYNIICYVTYGGTLLNSKDQVQSGPEDVKGRMDNHWHLDIMILAKHHIKGFEKGIVKS